MTFTIAIIGRPNVGKSTLFNKLAGRKLAIVHDSPGVTRDWKLAEANLFGTHFNIIDTAGLEESFDDSISSRMRQQTERALEQANMAFLVIDSKTGITPLDRHFAQWLRGRGMPAFLIANKCDTKIGLENSFEGFELGFGEPIAISAEHSIGMEEIYNHIRPLIKEYEEKNKIENPDQEDEDVALTEEEIERYLEQYKEGSEKGFGDIEEKEEDTRPIKIAIVGRPNVGKSTLLNTIVKEQRSMVGAEAGITRDAVHADWEYQGRQIRLVDTAGLRKRPKVIDKIEQMSALDTFRAIRLAQVVILVIDANLKLENQDCKIAQHVIEEGRALVIAVNKWDSITEKEEVRKKIEHQLESAVSQARGIKVTYISALKGAKIDKLFENIIETYKLWNKRVSTGKLNRWLKAVEQKNPAPLVNGRPNRLRYITQIKARPPTFVMWAGRADDYPDVHKRFLTNRLRETFEMPATPIRIIVKKSKNPYTD